MCAKNRNMVWKLRRPLYSEMRQTTQRPKIKENGEIKNIIIEFSSRLQ